MKISLSDLKLDVFWQRSRRGVLYALYLLGALVLLYFLVIKAPVY